MDKEEIVQAYEIDSPMDLRALRDDVEGTYEVMRRHSRFFHAGMHRSVEEIEAEMLEEVLAVQISLPAWLDQATMCDGAQGGLLAKNATALGVKLAFVMQPEWDVYQMSGKRVDLIALVAHLEKRLLEKRVIPVSEYAPGAQAQDCICAAQISGAVRETKVDIPLPKYRTRFHVVGMVTGPLIGAVVVAGGLHDGIANYAGRPTLADERRRLLNPQPPKTARKFPWFRGLT